MVVSTRRRRPDKPTGTIRLCVTGLILALSTSEAAYQDAVSLLSPDDATASRWQARIVAGPVTTTGEKTLRLAGYARPLRAPSRIVTGPDDLIIVGAIDEQVVTGSIVIPGLQARRINRAPKADLLVIRRDNVSAGFVKTVALFAPVEANLPRTAFVLSAHPGTLIAAVVKAPVKLPMPNARPTPPEAGAPPVIAAAYAEVDDPAAKAPFDAVLGKPMSNIVVPNVDANHAWVNYPLPPNARSANEQKCLATAIYFEARGESEKGQLAVAQVVINRLKNPAYPNTICGVVYQNKNKRNRCQFSFACDGIRDRISDMRSWTAAQALASKVVNNPSTSFMADVGTATHYHATYVRPFWARKMKQTQKIGRHIFYRTYGGGWS